RRTRRTGTPRDGAAAARDFDCNGDRHAIDAERRTREAIGRFASGKGSAFDTAAGTRAGMGNGADATDADGRPSGDGAPVAAGDARATQPCGSRTREE